jgi:hypothetical protein
MLFRCQDKRVEVRIQHTLNSFMTKYLAQSVLHSGGQGDQIKPQLDALTAQKGEPKYA